MQVTSDPAATVTAHGRSAATPVRVTRTPSGAEPRLVPVIVTVASPEDSSVKRGRVGRGGRQEEKLTNEQREICVL